MSDPIPMIVTVIHREVVEKMMTEVRLRVELKVEVVVGLSHQNTAPTMSTLCKSFGSSVKIDQ